MSVISWTMYGILHMCSPKSHEYLPHSSKSSISIGLRWIYPFVLDYSRFFNQAAACQHSRKRAHFLVHYDCLPPGQQDHYIRKREQRRLHLLQLRHCDKRLERPGLGQAKHPIHPRWRQHRWKWRQRRQRNQWKQWKQWK